MLNLAYIANIMSNLIANKTSEITRILDVLKLSAIIHYLIMSKFQRA